MGWCCCSAEEEDFNKVSNEAHNQFSGHNGNPGKSVHIGVKVAFGGKLLLF